VDNEIRRENALGRGYFTAKAAAFRAYAPTAAALPFFPPKETFGQ